MYCIMGKSNQMDGGSIPVQLRHIYLRDQLRAIQIHLKIKKIDRSYA